MNNYTPVINQYLKIKNNYKDSFLFFRMGDFYELFFDDAIEISKLLNLTLTNRGECDGIKIPMAGFPHISLDNYIIKLTKLNKKVAVCEQISNVKINGLIDRQVVFVSTPGTLVLDNYLKDDKNNYIVYIKELKNIFFLFCLDLSTGNFSLRFYFDLNKLIDDLNKLFPSEVLVDNYFGCYNIIKNKFFIQKINLYKFNYIKSNKFIKNLFGNIFIKYKNFYFYKDIILSFSNLISYITSFKNIKFKNIISIEFVNFNDILQIDNVSLKNLEIFKSLNSNENYTLFNTINHTSTSMGKRLLIRWLNTPLLLRNILENRLEAVNILKKNNNYKKILDLLSYVSDLERIIGRFDNNSYKPIDLKKIQINLFYINKIKLLLLNLEKNILLNDIFNNLLDFSKLINLIDISILENPSSNLKMGCSIIKNNFDHLIDKYRNVINNTQSYILECQSKERLNTKINDLIIKYSERIGYYIELKSNIKNIPSDYIKIKTLSGKIRYTSNITINIEKIIKNTYSDLFFRELKIYKVIVYLLNRSIGKIQKTSENIAILDILVSFAKQSDLYNWVEPKFTDEYKIEIIEGRHPIVEKSLNSFFIPNDLILNKDKKMLIITGANMGGKSTYMRQNALIILLASIGSHIPAKKALIGRIEKIFTRIGSSDDLSKSMSTFMLEIKEIVYILNQTNINSLVIIDEIGRGTGYLEGKALAFSILKDLILKKSFVLVSTHYHDLSILSKRYKEVCNIFFKSIEINNNLIFFYKYEFGFSNLSFPIKVAEIAGLSNNIIENANKEFYYLKEFDYMLSLRIIKFLKNIDIKKISSNEALIRLTFLKNFLLKNSNLCQN